MPIEGMILEGTVANIAKFGAFQLSVVKPAVHISEADTYIKDISNYLTEKQKIWLSLKC